MKAVFLLLAITCGVRAGAHDFFLLPQKFFLEKGEVAVWRLFVGDDFIKELEERPAMRYIMERFQCLQAGAGYNAVYDQGNYIDLLAEPGDAFKPAASVKTRNSNGLSLLHMDRGYARIAFSQPKFNEYLRLERLDDVLRAREGNKSRDSVREKYTRYIKSLVSVGRPEGELYGYRIGQTLEIILLQNPYKTKRGGSLAARIIFRDRPLVNASVEALCKDERGVVYKQLLKSNENGEVEFKADRAGAWMVRLTHMIPSKDKDADWESFWASYTFGMK